MSLLQASRLSPAKLIVAKMALRSMSSSHPNVYIGKDGMKRVKIDPNWKSWKDIPTECVVTYSKRDPDNPIYQHPQWIKIKKMQIWGQIDDGVPIWLKFGMVDKVIYYTLLFGTFAFSAYLYALMIGYAFGYVKAD